MFPVRSILAAAFLLAALAGCRPAAAELGWAFAEPGEAHTTARFADPRLTESSGVAVSRRYPGILWSHNDSGSPPWIFATDTLGRALGRFLVTGAENDDWEDIALGACGRRTCLYLADTGDNNRVREAATIYRFPEPRPDPGSGRAPRATEPATALRIRYPGGPHDVEAMYVDQAGDVYLVNKGRDRRVVLHRVPGTAWGTRRPALAEPVQALPIDPDQALGRWVTGAAIAPEGDRVAIRTYRDVFLFRRAGQRLALDSAVVCNVLGLGWQGEGVSWLDRQTLVLTSEGIGGTGSVAVTRCPE